MSYAKRICPLVTLVFSSIGFADQDDSSFQIPETHNRLYIAPAAAWYNIEYSSFDQSQSGPTYGGFVGYDYLENDFLYAGAQASYLAGKLTGSFGSNFCQEFWTEGRLGYRMSMGRNDQISWAPFTGFGYFVFLEAFSGDPAFRYHFMYIPLGIRGTWQPFNFLEMGLNAMGGIPFNSGWSQVDKHPGNTRMIAYIELPFRFFVTPTTKRYDLSLVPFWRNWSVRNEGPLFQQMDNIVGARIEFGFNL